MKRPIFIRLLEAWLDLLKNGVDKPYIKEETRKEMREQIKSLEWFLSILEQDA